MVVAEFNPIKNSNYKLEAMYYNRILRVWVIDAVDIFLISMIIGNIIASTLKDYLSEKKATERLKNSIIKKSKLLTKSNRPISNSKEMRIKKIYRVALGNRGGQLEEFLIDPDVSNEVLKLAQQIKGIIERLATFLKEREVKGVARIFFKNGRLLLELILYKCRIDITYVLLTEGLSTQVVVITATAGGALGFTLSWFSAGASLIARPLLISTLLRRSVVQQIINQREYVNFKELVNKMLEDEELKKTIRAVFMEGDIPPTTGIEMKDAVKNPLPEFNLDSDQTFEEFVKARMKDELGLIENPTPKQIQDMIHNRKIQRSTGKTVYFRDFIEEIVEDQEDIIDAEIVKKSIKLRVRNDDL